MADSKFMIGMKSSTPMYMDSPMMLDSKLVVASKEDLLAKIPLSKRSERMFFYVVGDGFYAFKGGLTDDKLVKIGGGSGEVEGVFITTSPVNNPIGKFSEGQTVEELDDISINEAINMLLHKDINPEFTFTSTNVITNETGSTLTNIEFKVLFTDVGSGTISRIDIKKDGVVIDSKTYSTGTISYSFVDSDSINLDTEYVAEVVYNFGNGDKILSKNLEFKFVKSGFYGTSNNETFTINSTNVRSLAPSLGIKKGSVLTINIPVGAKNVIFAYPSDLGDVNKVNYVEGMNADVKGIFTKTIAGITDASGTSVIMYNVYTYKPLTAFSQAVTYKVTV